MAAFIAILLLVLMPLQYVANSMEASLDSRIDHCTEELSDTIRKKGYLDTSTYETFVEKLDHTGEMFDIEIENIHPVTGEEFVLHNEKETVNLTYKNKTDRKLVFGVKKKNNDFSLKLSDSVIDKGTFILSSGKNEIQSFAAHTHTNDCYVGHRHNTDTNSIDSCYVVIGGPVTHEQYENNTALYKFVASFYYENGDPWQPIYKVEYRCPVCNFYLGQLIYKANASYPTIMQNQTAVNNTNYFDTYNNYSPNFSLKINQFNSIYNSINAGESYDSIMRKFRLYFNFVPNILCISCSSNYSTGSKVHVWRNPGDIVLFCNKPEDQTLMCDKVVTAISPTNPSQTIKKGESIITTAIATYLDGHTGTVNCTSNFNSSLNGYQTVTLTYTGLVGDIRTNGTRSCFIGVTVIDKTLSYITASPASQIIRKYGTPSYTVTAYYSDGTSKDIALNLCYTYPFDNTTNGQKTITISYTEGGINRYTTITVYVDDILSIVASPSEITVEKYIDASALPLSVIAYYQYSGSKNITSGCSITGYNPSLIGDQIITISYTDSVGAFTTTAKVHVTPLHKTCSKCGTRYDMNTDDSDPGCPVCKGVIVGINATPDELEVIQGSGLSITVQALYRDGTTHIVTGWTSDFSPYSIGIQSVTIRYGDCMAIIKVSVKEPEVICPVCGTRYPISKRTCPVCSEKVVSLVVTPKEVTVNQFDTIDLMVIANYADGSSREVEDWSIDCNTSTAGNYTANVSYAGCSYPINLTVNPLGMINCPICGLAYDVTDNPSGCPICSKTITGIEAYLTSGSNLVQYGLTPDFSVVLIFRDAHRELTNTGYSIDGCDPYKMGVQTITIRYKEFSYSLEIEIVDNLKTVTCPNGHVYYLNEDGSDPGCPFCLISESHEVVYYYDITYTYEILEELYKSGTYIFDKNNYINVSVTKKDVSILKKLQKFLFKTVMPGRKKKFTYGGEVF